MKRSKRKITYVLGANLASVAALITVAPPHLTVLAQLPSSSLTATAQTSGYRIVTTNGTVYSHGTSRLFGDAHALTLAKPIVGSASTADGLGYWLVASDGGIFAYGDAQFYGSTGSIKLNQPIVGMASTPDGKGYWLVASDGGIFSFGDAQFYGSTGAIKLNKPIVGMASTPDGKGYWLVASDGAIFAYGDAQFYGSTGSIKLNQPIVGIAATSTGAGYYLLAADGGIFNFGDAPFLGSQGGSPLTSPAISINTTVASVATASGSVGFDVSNYQCSYTSSPSVGSFDIIEASGWPFGAPNPCIAKEASWTNNNYELYMFMALPIDASGNWNSGTPTSQYQSGPQAPSTISNQAYDYGWNAAQYAFGVADNQGASSTIWWIDVEGAGSYWSNFPALNTQAIQGAVAFFNSKGLLAGIYSGNASTYATITTGTASGAGATISNTGSSPIPLWFYSGYGSSACTNLYNSDGSRNPFAGGVPWYIQTYPNNSIDIDYAC